MAPSLGAAAGAIVTWLSAVATAIVSTDPAYGFSKEDDGVVLFLFNWDHNDMGVDFDRNPPQVQSRK